MPLPTGNSMSSCGLFGASKFLVGDLLYSVGGQNVSNYGGGGEGLGGVGGK